jgi:hypothetical protein
MAAVEGVQKRKRIRAGATLGDAGVSVAINFGFPLTGVGVAVLYAAFATGGLKLWLFGSLALGFGLICFGSSRSL